MRLNYRSLLLCLFVAEVRTYGGGASGLGLAAAGTCCVTVRNIAARPAGGSDALEKAQVRTRGGAVGMAGAVLTGGCLGGQVRLTIGARLERVLIVVGALCVGCGKLTTRWRRISCTTCAKAPATCTTIWRA